MSALSAAPAAAAPATVEEPAPVADGEKGTTPPETSAAPPSTEITKPDAKAGAAEEGDEPPQPEPSTAEEIVGRYQEMKKEVTSIVTKMAELEADFSEHA